MTWCIILLEVASEDGYTVVITELQQYSVRLWRLKDAQLVLRGPKSVAEQEFYTWDGQGVAEANSGGPYTMTENQCITPTCQNKSYNF